ncbi:MULTISPECIES: hypothetical protein [Neisseriaceae]|uniref:hypothetical protein n=1 Tax=Neisseriaceae TaxID=481 RepID=UPI000D365D88|nr:MULTISPECIES: hypothetical protein [Neisseriaceae]
MKKTLSNLMLISFCSTMLTACPFWGSCADWNCSELNPRWKKAVDTCTTENRTFVLHELGNQLGYKSITEVSFSEIGQHISYQCIHHDGRYNIRKDKQYGHLFVQ